MKLLNGLVPKVYSAEALVPFTSEVKDVLTRKDKFGTPYTMYYRETPESPNVWVPRGAVSRKGAAVLHLVSNPVPMPAQYAPPQTPEQATCIEASTKLLKAGEDHIIEAPTGFGKSYVGAAVACNLGQKTLIVVTKNDLVLGWKNTLINHFGVNASDIGHIQQKVQKYQGKSFTVAMIHSLVGREYDPEMYQSFGLVIFDEVHRLGADYFSQACRLFPSQHRLGLSATPKRSDGKERMFEAHIGPVMVRGTWVPMKPKILVKHTGWKVPKVPQKNEDTGKWEYMPMKVMPGQTMNVCGAIADDVERNREIAFFTKSAVDASRTVLILSDLIERHLTPLFHYLVERGIGGDQIGFYHGQVPASQQEQAKTKRVVLATYAMCSEGTNVPHWDTLVMATPRANVKQAVGRVLRYVDGKKQPVVLDLVDDHPMLKNFHYSRLKQYYSIGGEVVTV